MCETNESYSVACDRDEGAEVCPVHGLTNESSYFHQFIAFTIFAREEFVGFVVVDALDKTPSEIGALSFDGSFAFTESRKLRTFAARSAPPSIRFGSVSINLIVVPWRPISSVPLSP